MIARNLARRESRSKPPRVHDALEVYQNSLRCKRANASMQSARYGGDCRSGLVGCLEVEDIQFSKPEEMGESGDYGRPWL
jgi:hypothetical protein